MRFFYVAFKFLFIYLVHLVTFMQQCHPLVLYYLHRTQGPALGFIGLTIAALPQSKYRLTAKNTKVKCKLNKRRKTFEGDWMLMAKCLCDFFSLVSLRSRWFISFTYLYKPLPFSHLMRFTGAYFSMRFSVFFCSFPFSCFIHFSHPLSIRLELAAIHSVFHLFSFLFLPMFFFSFSSPFDEGERPKMPNKVQSHQRQIM